jgi:hypothetical protein
MSKNMKIVLAAGIPFVLAIGVILALILTGGDKMPIAETRTFEQLSILDEDTYHLHINVDGVMDFDIYRRGKDVSFATMNGMRINMIANGEMVDFDFGRNEATYRPATEMDYLEMDGHLDGWSEILNLDGGKFSHSGVMEFWDLGELEYEEFRLPDRTIRRAFFDADGSIVGLHTLVGDVVKDLPYRVTREVPDEMFEIPFGLTRVPERGSGLAN